VTLEAVGSWLDLPAEQASEDVVAPMVLPGL
jgi:hypothetical protein